MAWEEVLRLLAQSVNTTGNREVGRSYRRLLRVAGFEVMHSSASCEWDGTPQATRQRALIAAELLRAQAASLVASGHVTAERIEELAAAVLAWGNDEDAFDAITCVRLWRGKLELAWQCVGR